MKKKILLVTQAQFGYLIDYYQYSKFLNEDCIIDYICWDYKKTKLKISGISIRYISRDGNIFIRNLRFLIAVIIQITRNNYQYIHIHYFRGCSCIALVNLKKRNLNLDVRTASVNPSKIKRTMYDFILKFESLFYKKITVISEGVRKKLLLPNNSKIIPLGGNLKKIKRQKIQGLNLIYVGTLDNRRINDTVLGIKLFLEKYPEINLKYSIIGKGNIREEELIKKTIDSCNLNDSVTLLGYIQNDLLDDYFQKCNLGISYIPITDYFNFQPPTKTFEYLLAGLPVLATATFENSRIINESNGVLTDDTPESFSKGLKMMSESIPFLDPTEIQNSVKEFEWCNIISKMRYSIIDS